MSNRLKVLREKATRPRKTVAVLLDGEVREQIEAVEDELDRLDAEPEAPDNDGRLASKPKAATKRAELLAELEQLREAAEESTLHLVVEGLQRTTFRALLNQHPAREGNAGDRLIGADMEAIALPLARACVVGYRERPEADAPVLEFPPDLVGYAPNEQEITLGFLLGFSYKLPDSDEPVVVEPWCTERQVDQIAGVALTLCAGDDAVPLPRRRSATQTSGAE